MKKNGCLHVLNAIFVMHRRDKEKATEPATGCFQPAKIDYSMGHNVNLFLLPAAVL